MNSTSKLLIIAGLSLIALGLLWQFAPGLFKHLGRLPGDIAIEKENARFYFPLTTSLILSAVFSLVVFLIQYFKSK